MAQLSTPYTDPECHNAQCHGQTGRRTTVADRTAGQEDTQYDRLKRTNKHFSLDTLEVIPRLDHPARCLKKTTPIWTEAYDTI